MIEVKLHDIGEGITEGEILHILKKPGEYVNIDEPLLEIQTDKLAAEIPSPAFGYIKEVKCDIGETVQVGEVLLLLDDHEKCGKDANSIVETETHIEVNQRNVSSFTNLPVLDKNKYKRTLAAPYTRKIARDYGVNIDDVADYFEKVKVSEEDVRKYVKRGEETIHSVRKETNNDSERQKTTEYQGLETAHFQVDTVPFSGVRKQIAKNMTRSLFTIPHVTHFDEVDMSKLVELREEFKQKDVNISAAAFFVKSLVIALKEYPVFNAELDEMKEKIYLKKNYHIGLAADSKNGLFVPVLRNADKKSILQINEEMKSLYDKVKKGKLTAAEMKGSTITISNVGPIGSIGATPIINYPETALISFHKMKKRAVVTEEDEIKVRPIMNISMSFDHRVADGGTAVSFTNRLVHLIENPQYLWFNIV